MKKELQSKFNTRQRMLAKDFEIYYYSDVRHSNVDPHTHNYYEFYFYLEGDVVFELNGEMRTLLPGDIIIVPPGLVHRLLSRIRTRSTAALFFGSAAPMPATCLPGSLTFSSFSTTSKTPPRSICSTRTWSPLMRSCPASTS